MLLAQARPRVKAIACPGPFAADASPQNAKKNASAKLALSY
jgi:hypothetical protein